MKGSDKAVVLGVVMAVVLIGFYIKVLSPKREEASKLGKDITDIQAQIDQAKQTAQFGEAARQEFPAYYSRLVVMGKAVPARADTSSLLVELNTVADDSGVQFRGIELATATTPSSSSTSSTTTPSSGSTPSSSSSGTSTTSTTPTTSTPSSSGSSTATPASATTPTPATEATAANLPLGATVGPDNLAVMPYTLTFKGSYFQVTDFLKGVDDFIHVHGTTQVAADGRLLTIDGFNLSQPEGAGPNPDLKVTVAVTSYVAPATEGLTAGASPTGPAPSLTQPETQPTSAPVSP
jgi:Tfp pilus assembly protein PilO